MLGLALMTADTLAPGLKLGGRYTLRRPRGQGGRVELPVEANVSHHLQLEVDGRRSEAQTLFVRTAETKTLRAE